MEAGRVERPAVEEPPVASGVAGIEALPRDELVDVFETAVVSRVDRGASVAGGRDRGRLVEQAAQCGPLPGNPGGIPRIHLDDPSEPERLAGGGRDVEAGVVTLPPPRRRASRKAVALVKRHARVVLVEPLEVREILVEVLFAGKEGPPRGSSSSAVVEGPPDRRSRGIGRRSKEAVPRGWPREDHRGFGGNPAVYRRVAQNLPAAVPAADLHEGHPVGGLLHVHVGSKGAPGRVIGEHEFRVRVLVVDEEDAVGGIPCARRRHEGNEVAVVAELAGLRPRRLPLRVEGGSVGKQRIAPLQEHFHAVTGSGFDGVATSGGDGGEAEEGLSGSLGRGLGRTGIKEKEERPRRRVLEEFPPGEPAIQDLFERVCSVHRAAPIRRDPVNP
jgi:hypothetical protein